MGGEGDQRMPDEMSSGLESVLKEQLLELRAIRALLESMDKKLEAVFEITEAKAISFARRENTL